MANATPVCVTDFIAKQRIKKIRLLRAGYFYFKN